MTHYAPQMQVSSVLCFLDIPNSQTQPSNAFTWSWAPPPFAANSSHSASSFLKHFYHSRSMPILSLWEAIANIFSTYLLPSGYFFSSQSYSLPSEESFYSTNLRLSLSFSSLLPASPLLEEWSTYLLAWRLISVFWVLPIILLSLFITLPWEHPIAYVLPEDFVYTQHTHLLGFSYSGNLLLYPEVFVFGPAVRVHSGYIEDAFMSSFLFFLVCNSLICICIYRYIMHICTPKIHSYRCINIDTYICLTFS